LNKRQNVFGVFPNEVKISHKYTIINKNECICGLNLNIENQI
jgi:hypothetical protein